MKTLESILHLCLGCDVMTPNGIGKLVGLPWQLLDKNNCHISFIKMVDTLKSSDNTSARRNYGNYLIKSIKPILRPLDSMTEEEGAYIGELVFGKYDSVKWRTEHHKGYVKIFRRHYSKYLCIDHKYVDIDFYDGGELDTSIHSIEVVMYLLSKSFDLFGLIDSGLALDATKLEGYGK